MSNDAGLGDMLLCLLGLVHIESNGAHDDYNLTHKCMSSAAPPGSGYQWT